MTNSFYQSIGQVCKSAGLDRSTIYVWEREIPSLKPSRSSGGHRYYTIEQVELLLYVKRLRYEEGYTFEGVRKRLSVEKRQIKQPADTSSGQSSADAFSEQTASNFSDIDGASLSELEKLLFYMKSELKEILSILQKRYM